MKNNIFIAIALILIAFTSAEAQNLFTENFEIPDSVVSSGIPGWAISNTVQTSGFFSDSTNIIGSDTTVLTTVPFSTLGMHTIKLNFDHIVFFGMVQCRVLVSIDNGSTWVPLGSNEYLGNGQSFDFLNYFSPNDYTDWSNFGNPCQQTTQFDNNRFKKEEFDMSAIVANQASVMVRFEANNDYYYSLVNCGTWNIDNILVTGNPVLLNSIDACNNDGTAGATPFFGSPPYTYLWSNLASGPTITNLQAGTYTVTVTDFGGTSVSDSVIINAPFEVFTSVAPATCPPGNNGSATAFVVNGTAPFTYLWSNGAATQQINNLSNGVYTITVTDANGCVVTESVNIFCGLGINISSTPAACNAANGTATINSVTNGVPPYTYAWSTNPVQTTQTLSGLEGNTFLNVTVIDAVGAFTFSSVIIPFMDTLNVITTSTSPSQCNLATGAAGISASGGTAPYSYIWNTNPPQSNSNANFLSAQTYSVLVTDNNGCTNNHFVNIVNISNMSATITGTPTQCGLSTGIASVNASGGTTPYSYSWNTIPTQTTANANNLAYGNHQVTITDNAGCTLVESVFIGKINNININVTYPNTSCICVDPTANVTGGLAPYTFLWDDGSTNQTANCMDEGYHYVQVTDASGCSQFKSFYVTFSANCYITVNGYVFADLNKNCIQDPGEYGIANAAVELSKPGFSQTALTNSSGYYSFYVLNDTFQLSHTPSLNWYANCPTLPSMYTLNSPAGSVISLNFADTTDSYFDEAALINCFISGRTRGFHSNYYVTVRNNGTNQLSGILSSTHDPILTYLNSNSLVTSYNASTQTAEWMYSGLNPGASKTFNLISVIPGNTPFGTVFSNTSSVTPLTTDVAPGNNTCNTASNVNGSYDPNDKISWPIGNITVDSLWHNYLINFQNTGTAPAIRVIIEDTLDTNFDLSTISNVIGSHPFSLDDSQLPLIRFVFDNINLPDSNLNEPESQGFISFRIKRNIGVPTGTQIANTAYIYFDFNPAIVTNTVINTVIIVGIDENESLGSVSVYPNPSSGSVYFDYELMSDEKKEIQLFNALNQLILKIPVMNKKGQVTIDLSQKPTGLYTYRIVSAERIFQSGKISLMK